MAGRGGAKHGGGGGGGLLENRHEDWARGVQPRPVGEDRGSSPRSLLLFSKNSPVCLLPRTCTCACLPR